MAADSNAEALAAQIAGLWRGGDDRFVVFTGGEPLLQLDEILLRAVKARGFQIAVESNGTIRRAARHRLAVREPQGGRAPARHRRGRS